MTEPQHGGVLPVDEVDTLVVDPAKAPVSRVDHPADGQPAGDALGPAPDTPAGKPGLYRRAGGLDTHLNDALGQEVGHLTPTEVVFGEQPQVADVDLPGVVDADPGPVVELVDVGGHNHDRSLQHLSLSGS